VRVFGAVAQLVGVDGGQHVGCAERLANIALALDLAHGQGVVADAVRGGADAVNALGRGMRGSSSGRRFN
jgi:hypothetical protein